MRRRPRVPVGLVHYISTWPVTKGQFAIPLGLPWASLALLWPPYKSIRLSRARSQSRDSSRSHWSRAAVREDPSVRETAGGFMTVLFSNEIRTNAIQVQARRHKHMQISDHFDALLWAGDNQQLGARPVWSRFGTTFRTGGESRQSHRLKRRAASTRGETDRAKLKRFAPPRILLEAGRTRLNASSSGCCCLG
jgi:hypothetical protein